MRSEGGRYARYDFHDPWYVGGGDWYWGNYIKYFGEKGYSCVPTTLRYHDMDPKSLPDPRLGTTSILDYAKDIEAWLKKSINEY